jgi:hypothetical protein
MIKFSMKQKRKPRNSWLVRRPDGGCHEWLMQLATITGAFIFPYTSDNSV